MKELSEIFKNWAQLDSLPGISVLLVLIVMLCMAAFKLMHRKHINSNGKVVVTRRIALPLGRLIPKGIKSDKKTKPFSLVQRRLLGVIYSIHEALFGLIIFAFGLALVTKVYFEYANGQQTITDPVIMVSGLIGVIAMPIGALLVYFRNSDNPFK
ncbi:MAG: hypothetical protein AB8B97_21000 [Granulosicoccus sp.]